MAEQYPYHHCSNSHISYGQGTDYPPFEPNYMHTHSSCEIYCVYRGNGYYITEGTRHKLEYGKIFLMRPGEAHRPELTGESPYCRVSFHFKPYIVDGIDPQRQLLRCFFDRPLGLQNVYDRSVVSKTGIYELLRKMAVSSGDPERDIVHVTALLFSVLDELNTLFDAELFNAPTQSAALMHNVVAYVNENLTAPLSVDQICEKFYLSRGQLNRSFKSSTGASVWDYIVTKRLLLAKRYIADGMGAQEASQVCGFTDYSAFYRAYTKKYGVSPTGNTRKA